MGSLKRRVDKLEDESGTKGSHLLEVQVLDGELLQDAVNRAAEKAGIDPKAVGMAHLHGPNLEKTLSDQGIELEDSRVFSTVRLNGYRGEVRDLVGYVSHEEFVIRHNKECEEQRDALKAWREKKGYSQSEATKELGLPDGLYAAMESGYVKDIPNSIREVIGVPLRSKEADEILTPRFMMRWEFESELHAALK